MLGKIPLPGWESCRILSRENIWNGTEDAKGGGRSSSSTAWAPGSPLGSLVGYRGSVQVRVQRVKPQEALGVYLQNCGHKNVMHLSFFILWNDIGCAFNSPHSTKSQLDILNDILTTLRNSRLGLIMPRAWGGLGVDRRIDNGYCWTFLGALEISSYSNCPAESSHEETSTNIIWYNIIKNEKFYSDMFRFVKKCETLKFFAQSRKGHIKKGNINLWDTFNFFESSETEC